MVLVLTEKSFSNPGTQGVLFYILVLSAPRHHCRDRTPPKIPILPEVLLHLKFAVRRAFASPRTSSVVARMRRSKEREQVADEQVDAPDTIVAADEGHWRAGVNRQAQPSAQEHQRAAVGWREWRQAKGQRHVGRGEQGEEGGAQG